MHNTSHHHSNNETSYAELLKMLQDERQRVAEAETMNDALVSSIGDGIIIINEYGNITQVNQATLDMLGYDRQELEGSWLPKTIPTLDKEGEELPISERPVVRALLTGYPTSEIISYIKKDGTSFPVSSTASPFLVHGKPRGAIITFRDFSHEVSVERAKDEFVSLASHQLRTPLTSIRMFAEILKGGHAGKLNIQQQDYIDKIRLSAERMLDLVADFLNISRLELGRLRVNPIPTDVEKLVESQIVEIKPQLESRGVALDFKPSNLSKTALIDPNLVAQVLHNLFTNAVRYTEPRKGKIKIEINEISDELRISITDNGIGIPKADQPHIFQRLYRADNAIKSQKEGTGLGLYLAQQILEASGGNISCTSREGKGTTFIICLPAYRQNRKLKSVAHNK